MEEDIKILEDLKNRVTLVSANTIKGMKEYKLPFLNKEERKAIENLINRNKELEEENRKNNKNEWKELCNECSTMAKAVGLTKKDSRNLLKEIRKGKLNE